MKITYIEDGDEKTLEFINGVWTGEDPELVGRLSVDPHEVIGHHDHYPTKWHLAKAVADVLGGTLEPAQEPEIPSEEGVVY